MINYFLKFSGHYKAILKLGIPIVIGQLGIVFLAFADNIMIGQYNTLDLAAASFVNNTYNLPILFGLGFSYALTPIVGQLFGRKDYSKVGETLKNSLLLNFLMSILIATFMFIFWLNIDSMGQPVEILSLIKKYYMIQLFSIPFIMLFNSFKQFGDGITKTKISMYIMLSANLLNVVLNYIFIYGKLGFPEMGVIGAGIATFISRIMMLVLFIIIFIKSKDLSVYKEGFINGKLNKSCIRVLNKMGWMIGIQMGLETGLFTISSIFVGWFGSVSLAAHQIVVTVSTLGFMVYYGIGAAVAVRVSNFYGQNDLKNVRSTTFAGFHITLCLAIIASTFFILTRNVIGDIFTNSQEVKDLTSSLMIILLFYQFGDPLQITFANALRGINDVSRMMVLAFIGYMLVALPTCYFLGITLGYGVQGIWLGYPVGLTTAGILFYLRFNKKTKMTTAKPKSKYNKNTDN